MMINPRDEYLINQGREEGIKKGKEEGKLEIAKKTTKRNDHQRSSRNNRPKRRTN